jgi:hypothetical protein
MTELIFKPLVEVTTLTLGPVYKQFKEEGLKNWKKYMTEPHCVPLRLTGLNIFPEQPTTLKGTEIAVLIQSFQSKEDPLPRRTNFFIPHDEDEPADKFKDHTKPETVYSTFTGPDVPARATRDADVGDGWLHRGVLVLLSDEALKGLLVRPVQRCLSFDYTDKDNPPIDQERTPGLYDRPFLHTLFLTAEGLGERRRADGRIFYAGYGYKNPDERE